VIQQNRIAITVIPEMSTPKDGGPAFPQHGWSSNNKSMSARDWFAGQALMGIMVKGARAGLKELASDSYDIADAMLHEREKQR
jgi:hypothetical protein